MPFVSRDKDGNITAVYEIPQPGRAEEEVSKKNAQLKAFLKPKLTIAEQLRGAFDTLPVAVRAQFAGTRAEVRDALEDGDLELAKYIIDNLQPPPELISVKVKLQGMFPKDV
jgi:hypothetical protein